ncbi:MAG: hybrid sensor histidine kinase/response regulator [Deltaproteobacteria bacterium]|nr:hybrid sensor histidine kinase/response regulator [Deltaproteobacteria bacterium]
MAQILTWIPYDRSILARFAQDPPEVRRRARLVAAFSVLAFSGGTTLAFTHLFLFRIPFAQVIAPLLAGLCGLLVPFYLVRSRSLPKAGHVIAACWLLAVGWGVYLRGGLASPPLMCQVAVPFIALTLIGPRAALFWLGVVTVEMLAYPTLAAFGVVLPDQMAQEFRLPSNLVAASLFGSLMLAMGFALEWLRVKASEELAEAQEKEHAAEREAQMLRADRLTSLGQLAASLGHELNNPLAYVLGNLELLTQLAPQGELTEPLADALDGATKMRTIVQDLRTFTRGDEERLGPVDLKSVVASSLRMVAGEVKHRALVRTELADVPAVLANDTRLGQILVNLLVNAAHAIPERRALPGEIVISSRLDATGAVVLEVRDNGTGIPPEILHRVTEPFFTTKPVGVGTGLGLSVCENLVRRFGGAMQIASTVGVGTTIAITLPAVQKSSDTPLVTGPRVSTLPHARTAQSLRVLVIDDDDAALRTLERTLRVHEVTCVRGAPAALTTLAKRRDFDLILCDVMMPEMTGPELAQALAARDPELAGRIVFMTGGAITQRTQQFLAQTSHVILQKPLEVSALERVLARTQRRAA